MIAPLPQVDDMWSAPREERPKWKELLEQGAKLLEKPRQPLPKVRQEFGICNLNAGTYKCYYMIIL